MVKRVDFFYHCVLVIVWEDGQQRPEDFLLHDGIIIGNIAHYDRLNAQGGSIRGTAQNNLFLIYKAKNTVKMLFIDYLSVLRILKRFVGELPDSLLLKIFYEFLIYAAVAQNIVGGNAGLPAVQIFSEYNSSRGKP